MHYPGVIHCLAITLLVCCFFSFWLCSMPLAKQESFLADAKIKIAEYQISHMVDVTEHRGKKITRNRLGPIQMKSGPFQG